MYIQPPQHELANQTSRPPLAASKSAEVLTEIYDEYCNIAVWHRGVSRETKQDLNALLSSKQSLELREIVSPAQAQAELNKHKLGAHLCQDISELVDMFCCLFDLSRAGLRLKLLNHSMCPKFHIDQVPCRLVHSYCGPGTQWLNAGDISCATDYKPQAVNQIQTGDVALLKGNAWEDSGTSALIHRSPNTNEQRLLLTLDFA